MNRSGYTLGYGIQLYNPNAFSVTVAVHGSGWVTNAYGGAPWRQLFNAWSQAGTSYTVPAYGVLWVMRKDASIPNGNFFSGVVDFTVSGGSVQVHNHAYRSFAAINGTAQYMGYVRRISPYNNHNEALVYKGTSPYTEAIATQVHFTFKDSDRDRCRTSIRASGCGQWRTSCATSPGATSSTGGRSGWCGSGMTTCSSTAAGPRSCCAECGAWARGG
ncbi:MAG TPA: hypothetical protein VEY88_04915 [Archangium sp.]|nr:hypothetical protein [Archangium sp.]